MIKWVFKNQQKNIKIKYLKKILNINSKLSILLLQRKINSYKKAKDFFCPNIKKLYNPFLMKDMNIAVKYILFFIKKKKKILLYGDYDVDGITSVSMFYLFIKKELKYDNIYYYIPNRKNEGYGLSYKGIDFAKSINISLIITLDCGSKDKLKIDYAKKKGIKIIICDHHIIEKNINNSIAFLNPKRLDCKYPFKYLSGCGVTFKYIHGISKILKIEKKIYKYLHFVTISIASDVVPLINENRIISFYGLKNINENYNNKIFDLLNKKKYISISDIIFQISPKLNSTGRIENAKISVDFFIKKKNKNILNKINKINIKRKKINEKILKESIYFINKYEKNKSKIIILFKKDWEIGVLGIVASKIVEIYYKPTIIFTNNNNDKNLFIASGRSIKEFNIYKEVKKCSNFLHSFGGHNYAIGLTLKKKNFIIFKKKIKKLAKKKIKKKYYPKFIIDVEINFSDINLKFLKILNRFEPFGKENKKPIFLSKKVFHNGFYKKIGKNKSHLMLKFFQENYNNGIISFFFNISLENYNNIKNYKYYNIIYNIDYFFNKNYFSINILDIKNIL